jgi:hypothetical protein
MPLPADRDGGGPRFAPSGSDLTFECALDCVLPTPRIRVDTPRSGLSNDGWFSPLPTWLGGFIVGCGVTLWREGGVSAALVRRPA